jgi:hypothetical protein
MFKIAKLSVIVSCSVLNNLNFLLILSHSSPAKEEQQSGSSTKPDDDIFTPVLMSVISAPNPVKGSDGKFHLVYELKVTNATNIDWEIRSVEVRDGSNDK